MTSTMPTTKANLLLVAAAFALAIATLPARAQGGTYVPKKNDGRVYAELTKAPKKAIARRNPMEKDPDAEAAGANLFDQHCAECHGELAEGTRKGPSLRVDQVQQATPGTLFWILTNGVVRRGMPVWSKLPEPERWQIVSYLKSLTPVTTAPKAPQ
jgi:mono/diheme cytochrome c family protein